MSIPWDGIKEVLPFYDKKLIDYLFNVDKHFYQKLNSKLSIQKRLNCLSSIKRVLLSGKAVL